MEICCHGARQGLSDSLYFLYGRKNELWMVQNIFLLLQICPIAGVCCRPCNPSKWEADIWGWHLRMTWGQEVCYALLHSKPAFVLGCRQYCLIGGTWGWLGVERCQLCLQDTYRGAKWHQWATVVHWVSFCVLSVVGWLIVYQDGNYLYPGQYSQTICQSQIGWYHLWGGNILMTRPSTFLESRSWS